MQVLFYCSETYDDSIENEKSLQNARIIKEFWNDYYAKLLDIDKTKKTSNVDMYQDDVRKLLINEKKNQNGVFSDTELIDLQNQIANCTMKFDEDNLFKVTPNIVKFLINKDQPNAKQYLKGCLPSSLPMLKMFGIYTLEAIMIHVLGLVFNTLQESSAVKAARFIDQLNSTVREQARFLQYKAPGSGKVEAVLTSKVESVKDVVQPKGASKKEKKKKIQCHYDIGKYLLQFMIERNVLHISTDRGVTKEDPVRSLAIYQILPRYKIVAEATQKSITADTAIRIDDVNPVGVYFFTHALTTYRRLHDMYSATFKRKPNEGVGNDLSNHTSL
ncbi:hypothetical protein TRIUR3_06156 [Triticum urartu]|uniref:Uncharacterized protein n=1 Tax=Triticum urartu TaxID=4572 RepID=M7ZNX0_TRIUA|nr:hypothetical protein TRIUR3_06156 [Triticum urartu]